MNPLFLLFGLFGAGVFSLLGSNQRTTTNSTAATKPPQSPPTTGEEPEEPAPAPEVPVEQEAEPKPEPQPEQEPEPEEPVGQQPKPEPQPEPVPEPEDPVGQQPEPAPEPEDPVSQQPSAPQPEPEPTPTNPTPAPPEQTGGGGDAGGETAPLAATGTHSVYAGRVATFEPVGDDVTSIRIIDGVNHGNVTVNPDNTMALVMTLSDFTGRQSFRYEATHADGSTSTHSVNLNVQPGLQDEGWGTGENHYMLATDADDRVIVEHGEVHTKVYVSAGDNGLSLAEIAAQAGVSQGSINGTWLAQNGYGQSESLALDPTAGMMLWHHVTPQGSQTSNWLLLERGHEYDLGRVMLRDTSGESELHPVYMGAWGDGARPVMTNTFVANNESIKNAVIHDIHFSDGFTLIGAENVIIDNSQFTNDESAIMGGSGVTVRNSDYTDIFRQQSLDGGNWEAASDRIQAIYASGMDGLMVEGNLFDHTGWEEGYDYDGSGTAPQWPSMFSHNVYIDNNNLDVTVRDIITMRGSAFGLKVRSGGFIEDNVLLDNNIGVEFLGGEFYGAGNIGEYTLFADNLITSGAYKNAERVGARAWGADASGELSTLVDNIIAHMADPNNPEEIAAKTGHFSFGYQNRSGGEYHYDDTIVYNWAGNTNLGDLDTSVLNQTTIQLFTEQLLGAGNGTIEDLANFLRAQAADGMYNDTIDADAIIAWFQQGFGLYEAPRSAAETVRFVPDDLGEGVRWDNRLNWSTDDLPGSVTGDSADLGGNTVIFNGNATIDELEFGPEGRLELYGGRLTVAEGMTTSAPGAEVLVSDAGQLWADGHEGERLDIDIVDGRFVNTGALRDASLTATGGEAVLATGGALFGVSAGETLSLSGGAEAGFDDDDGGMGLLVFEEGSTLELTTGDGALGSIGEFRTGAFGDEPDVLSGIDVGNAALRIDLNGLSAAQGSDLMLLEADEIIGAFDSADIAGLGSRNASVVIDYANDSVSLELSSGSGEVMFRTIGQQSDVTAGEEALWEALTAGQGVFDETAVLEDLEDEIPDAA